MRLSVILPLLGLVLAIPTVIFGQKKELKVKFGKFSSEETNMKVYEAAPSAPGVVLFDKMDIEYPYNDDIGFSTIISRHTRIKIFKKEAYKYADVVIPYFGDEKVQDLKASSFNMENGKMVETELKDDNVFDEKITKRYSLRKFTMDDRISSDNLSQY